MKNLKTSIFCLMLGLTTIGAKAQIDPHFSQYYAYPLLLNPALTGAIDGDYRLAVNAKQQWNGLDNGYITGAASFDMAPVKQLSFGATLLNESAGDVGLNYLNALVSSSYRINFGNNESNVLSFGLQAGIINQSFDASKVRLGDQYDPSSGYNPGMPTNEDFSSTSSLAPDINAGIMYFDGNTFHWVNLFAGASAAHLNRPINKFMGQKEKTPVRYTAHGGARIRLSDAIDLTPNAIYMQQGNAHEIAAGAYAQLTLTPETDVLVGSNYRFNDAAIGFVGLRLKSLTLGLSYDVNVSSLQNATNNNGGFEVSISYIKRKSIVGPHFFCPRL